MGSCWIVGISFLIILLHNESNCHASSSSSSSTSSTSEEDSLNEIPLAKTSTKGASRKPKRHDIPRSTIDKIALAMLPGLERELDYEIPIPDQNWEDKCNQKKLSLSQGRILRLYTIDNLRNSIYKVDDSVDYEMLFSFDIPVLHYGFEYSATTFGYTLKREGDVAMHLTGRNVVTILAGMPKSLEIEHELTDRCVLNVKTVQMSAIGYPSVKNIDYKSFFKTGMTRIAVYRMIRHLKKRIVGQVRGILEESVESAVRKSHLVCPNIEIPNSLE